MQRGSRVIAAGGRHDVHGVVEWTSHGHASVRFDCGCRELLPLRRLAPDKTASATTAAPVEEPSFDSKTGGGRRRPIAPGDTPRHPPVRREQAPVAIDDRGTRAGAPARLEPAPRHREAGAGKSRKPRKPRPRKIDRRVRWTRDLVIARMQEWTRVYGGPPSVMEWMPTQARLRGRPEWAQRFADAKGHWPGARTVMRLFGSWTAGLAAAGLEPRACGARKKAA